MAAGGNSERFSIRQASASDAEAIRDVYLSARLSAMPWLPLLHAPDEVKTWLATYVIPFSKVFVAEIGGKVIGFAALKDDVLDHLYVRPDCQRGGTGAALLNAVKTESQERLRLYTFARNTLAKRFYEKHGFRALAFSDGKRNQEREPDILLELDIGRGSVS
jgi:ribosomal protein S18 acetylase RimI-like enzyme